MEEGLEPSPCSEKDRIRRTGRCGVQTLDVDVVAKGSNEVFLEFLREDCGKTLWIVKFIGDNDLVYGK